MAISGALRTDGKCAGCSRPDPTILAEQPRQTALAGMLIVLALIAPTALAWTLDDRQLIGVSVWDKPLKFEISISLHLATLVLLLPLVDVIGRSSRELRWSMLAATFAAIFEIGAIVTQAARGRASHFNNSTLIEGALYILMGIGAVTMVVGAFILGLQIVKHASRKAGEGLRLGAATGLLLGAVATLIIAGLMSSGQVDGPGHWVGGVRSDASGLPLVGWSTTGGDLRVPHFFATHAMQALPIAGWLADRALPSLARKAVIAATIVWAALIVATFTQALMGAPLIPI